MITSIQNERIKHIRALLTGGRQRESDQAFVIEGVRLAEEAYQAGHIPHEVYYTQTLSKRGMGIVENWANNNVSCEELSEDLMRRISDTEQSQGIMAVLPMIELNIPTILDFVILLDGIQDPGNLGTILRTAAAGCAQLVLLAPGCADGYSPKVLRAGMGAQFHIPILSLDWTRIESFSRNDHPNLRIMTSELGSTTSLWEKDLSEPLMWIIGSEAQGVCENAQSLAQEAITIPMPGKTESLNAAVSAGILIFETVRQRSLR